VNGKFLSDTAPATTTTTTGTTTTTTTTTVTNKTTKSNLNLRDAASTTTGKVMVVIPKGSTVEVVSGPDANGWYQVKYSDKTGYVNGTYLTDAAATTTTTTTGTTTTTTTTTTKKYTKSNLNLRDAASTATGKVMVVIPKGSTVEVVSGPDTNGWYQVKYSDKTGYVNGTYLTDTAPTTTTTGTTTTTTTTKKYTKSNLNLRDAASTTTGKVQTVIPKGSTVEVVSGPDTNGWYQVKYSDKTGYVNGTYLTDTAPITTTTTTTTTATTTKTTKSNLNLRDAASTTTGKIMTTIPKGSSVEVVSGPDANGWYQVKYSGKTGYVNGTYLK